MTNPDPLAQFIATERSRAIFYSTFGCQITLDAVDFHLLVESRARALDIIDAMRDALAERRAYASAADMYGPEDKAIDATCSKIEQAACRALEGR
jgi:hypothetical protein